MKLISEIFIDADRVFKKYAAAWNNKELKNIECNNGSPGKFNPPPAHHFGDL